MRFQARLLLAAAIVIPPATALSPRPAFPQSSCFRSESKNLSINTNHDGKETRIKWSTTGCKGTVTIRGTARMAGDLSDIETLSPGGEFQFTLDDGRDERVVLVRNEGGRLTHSYKIGRREHAWDAAARAWFANELSGLVRRTGFAADERVDYLLKHRGLAGVIQEVQTMNSDYVQGLYLRKTLGKASLNASAVESVVNTGAKVLESDHELANLLIEVADKYQFTPALRSSFIHATGSLSSDYEHRRTLAAVLAKGGLSTADVVAILEGSRSLGSDYEKAELLMGISSRYKLDPAMRAAYLTAARGIGSDYEKGRVFKAFVAQGALSDNDLNDVLGSISSIRSDYERAELLLHIIRNNKLTDSQKDSMVRAAGRLRSEYERGRVDSALLRRTNM